MRPARPTGEGTMLWYKSWLDTQRWFLLGLMLLMAQVLALYMSYPMDPATSYPNGALAVSPAEMALVRLGDFRSYVWVRWFSTTMLLFWPVFAAVLAATGFEGAAGREYLLSLPVTRRRIAWTRLALASVQIVAFTVVPSLFICAMAPLVGQRYPVADALAYSLILSVGGFGLFGLTMFLRTTGSDVTAYAATGTLVVLWGLITFVVKDVTPYSVFRVMNGADYFFYDRLPWTGLGISAAAGAALVYVSVWIVEHRGFRRLKGRPRTNFKLRSRGPDLNSWRNRLF